MGRSSKEVYGADGSTNLLSFAPEKLKIITDKSHPLYDERHALPVDDATVRNMMAFGVLEPIIVTLDTESGEVLVVDGRQRVKNAAEANRRLHAEGRPTLLVPATTRKGDNAATLFGVMVATNELRQSDPPLIRAAKMQRLKNLGQDDDAVALAFGVNKLTVKNTLALLDCGKTVQKAVEAGYIGITDSLYLSRLTPSQQTAKVEEIIRATAGKTGHAKAKAKREVVKGKSEAPKMKTRAQVLARYADFRKEQWDQAFGDGFGAALEWVLGGAPAEPEKDTKTRDLVDELAQAPAG
jgi:ParB family chromosome partitioning protein